MAGIAAAVIAAFVGLQYYLGRQQIAEERQQRQKLIMHAADHILKPQLLVGAADSLLLLTASPTSDWDDPYVKQINSTLQVLREVRRIKKLDGTQTGGGADLSGRSGAGPPVTRVSVNPNLDIPLIVAVAGSPPVLHFLSFGDGGRTVRWLGKMPAPEFAGGWVRARWSPDGHRIFLGGGGATAVVITPCNLSDVSPYLGELCRGKTEDDVQKIGDGVHAVGFGAWTADGKDVVTNSYLGHPNVWNAATGALDRGLLDQIPLRPEENDSLTCLAISPSGHSFAEGDRSGSIVIVNEQSKAGSHLGPQPGFSPNQIYFNPANETEVVAISQNKTILWQTGMSESVNLPHNYASVMQAAFDPKGRFLVTGANDGTVRLWMLDRGRRSPLIIRSSRSSFADIMGPCSRSMWDRMARSSPAPETVRSGSGERMRRTSRRRTRKA